MNQMQERFQKVYIDIMGKWEGLDRKQKIRLSLGAFVMIIALAITIYFIVRPQMEVLISNSDMTTISKVEGVLNDNGIYNKIIDNGRAIQVKKSDSIQARMVVQQSPEIGSTDMFTYENMFEQGSGIGTSESIKKEMARIALQSDIATFLMRMDGIQGAQVILNPQEGSNIFLRESQIASATVYIEQSSQDAIDRSQAVTIAEAVAGAVQGLSKENVTITNQFMETVFSGESMANGTATSENDVELQKKNQLKYEVISILNPMFDDVRVTANLSFNWDKNLRENIEYVPSDTESMLGIPSSISTTNRSATGPNAGGEVGLGANDNATNEYVTGGNNTVEANEKSTDTSYVVGERKTITEESTGDLLLDESSLSIVVYNYKRIQEEYMTQNGRLEELGYDNWEDYKEQQAATVIPVETLEPLRMNIATGTGIPLERVNLIGYEQYYFEDFVATPIDWQQILLFAILAALILLLAIGLVRRSQPDEVIDVVPELSVEDLLVSTQLEEVKESEVERLRDIDYTAESEVKKQIDKFVNEKPEAVAQLLRNWLNESWE